MSLIGLRPLLPRDQPKNIEIRLMVRPGITGRAQVNGGVQLSPEEKEQLDRTPDVEQTVRAGVLQINEPQPRRVSVYRPFVPSSEGAG